MITSVSPRSPVAVSPCPRVAVALWWVFLVFPALFAPAALAAGETSDLVAKIQERYDGVRSLRADFLQETSSRATALATTAHGTVYYLKPRAMRWDYKEPQQQFVINGDEAWLYAPEEKTVHLYQLDRIIRSPVVLSFFSGLGQLRETFQISQLPDDPGPPKRHRLELLPRDPEMKAQVSKVGLWIEPETYRVVRIQTVDPLGNTNQIILSNFQVNAPLSPSLFTLQVPKGVKVQRQEVPSH